MNNKRGFFRIWIVLACIYYLVVFGIVIFNWKSISYFKEGVFIHMGSIENIINCDDQEWKTYKPGVSCKSTMWIEMYPIYYCMKENFYKLPIEERTYKNYKESKKKLSNCIKTKRIKEIYSNILEKIYSIIVIAFLPFLLFIIFYILGKIFIYMAKGFKK